MARRGRGGRCEDEKRLLFRKISRCNGTHRRDIICADAGEGPSLLKEGREVVRMAAAVLEIVKRITGFIVGVLIGCMMERWAYKKIWNLKKPSRVKEISIRFLQWVIVLLLIFLFLVAVDLLGYAAIKAVM